MGVQLFISIFQRSRVALPLICALLSINGFAQIINGYAQVTSISGATLNVGSVQEGGDSFEVGEEIIIIQIQDNVIGGNTGNNSSFGNLSSIQSAGLYEILQIASVTESGGTPTSITVSVAPNNSYNTGSNNRVQIVTFPQLGSPNHTTSAAYRPRSWNGSRGGVLAFQVSGILTLAHNIQANNRGFRGANANGGSSTGCSGNSNFRVSSQNNYADKGEGIYRDTDVNYQAGMAKIINGGGGGNSHNAGGGGGGNYSTGGQGGPGWPNCSPTPGGQGGISLNAHIGATRIFLGGGGGSGEGNNGGTQDAGDGGGIILIKANEIRTTGSCGGRSISANGMSITTGSGGDGNSGAGAGGSIVFQVNTWNIASTCPLTIEANGGDGGDVTHGDIHGAGGGGGMGAILFSTPQPTTNITTNNLAGSGGRNCNTCSFASDGGGSSGDGVSASVVGPLPVELASFLALKDTENGVVNLHWLTRSELMNDYFTIERSIDSKNFEVITTVSGEGTTNDSKEYHVVDFSPYLGTNYYRLSQTDFDGSTTYFPIQRVEFNKSYNNPEPVVYPNPSNSGKFFISIPKEQFEALESIKVVDPTGKQHPISKTNYEIGNNMMLWIEINHKIQSGIFFIQLTDNIQTYTHKLVVQ